MRKIVSIALALVMVVTLAVPAFAAEPKKTLEQRAAAIMDTYGVGVYVEKDMNGYKFTQADRVVSEKIMTNLETALSMVGTTFIKKLNKDYETKRKETNYRNIDMNGNDVKGLAIVIMGYAGRPLGFDDNMVAMNVFCLSLISYGSGSNQEISVRRILEMLGSGFAIDIVDNAYRGAFASEKYGVYNGASPLPANFVSSWGSMGNINDYSSVFAYMVANNGQNKFVKDSILWKKGKIIYDDLVKYMGTGARATQRAAANLGIEMPKTK